MKRICVFGAGGRTGRHILRQATKLGYEVTAFIHTQNANVSMPDNVKIRVGDILDQHAVYQAVKGNDAVISVIGHIRHSDPLVQTKGMQNIVRAMKVNRIKRVISLTGTGVRLPHDQPSLIDRVLNVAIRYIDPDRIKDGIKHTEVLQKSTLDWTVLRVLKLTNRSMRATSYRLSDHGPAELLTPRVKVARIMLDLLDSEKFIRKMPVVSM